MLDNLIFSLNSTMPIFLLMMFGYFLHHINWMDDQFAMASNKFVFRVALPAMLFADLAVVDYKEVWDGKFVLFCFLATVLSIAIAVICSMFFHNPSTKAELIQSSYRSSAAILGIAFIQNIYGSSGMAPLMIFGSVPLYNMMAVTVLMVYSPEGDGKVDVKKTLKGIVTNPIILGIVVGMLWSLFRIPLPTILGKAASRVGAITTPLGLIAMGASFKFGAALKQVKPVITATVLKLFGFCAMFLPLAMWMGFRDEKLVAILVMLGSPTTVASFTMAKSMGHDGVVSSGCVMLTTLLSAFTLTAWLFILKSLGWI